MIIVNLNQYPDFNSKLHEYLASVYGSPTSSSSLLKEDIDTTSEDHLYDALRYGCMSRPMHTSYAERFNRTPRVQFTPSDRIFEY